MHKGGGRKGKNVERRRKEEEGRMKKGKGVVEMEGRGRKKGEERGVVGEERSEWR